MRVEHATCQSLRRRVSWPRTPLGAGTCCASNGWSPVQARLVLTTSCRGVARSDLRILWGDPSIRVRRSGSDLVTALQSTLRRRGARGFWVIVAGSDNAERLYALWVREHEPSAATLLEQRRRSEGSGQTLGLITFVDRSQGWKPDATIHSVLGQSYPNWEWIVVGPDDSLGHLQRTIAHLGPDPRIRTVAVAAGSHRALAWNVALDATRAPYAALLGANDTLSPSALFEMAAVLEGVESPDVLYSDGSVSRREPPARGAVLQAGVVARLPLFPELSRAPGDDASVSRPGGWWIRPCVGPERGVAALATPVALGCATAEAADVPVPMAGRSRGNRRGPRHSRRASRDAWPASRRDHTRRRIANPMAHTGSRSCPS